MNQHSNPIEFLIEFAWATGADRFIVNNAKDELKKLRIEQEQIKNKTKEWSEEVFKANQFAVEQTKEYLDIYKQMEFLKESLAKPVAWARINSKGDLYDLRMCKNSFVANLIPLYVKLEDVEQAMQSMGSVE